MLDQRQFGFRKGLSTKDALIGFVHDIQQSLDQKKVAAAIFIDLKKAFDTVDHAILLRKLEKYGIRGIALEWFNSCLNNRSQCVRLEDTDSDFLSITCGVPQGSNLGPLLFLIYINDLPQSVRKCNPVLFADDTTVYSTADTSNVLTDNLNTDLVNLQHWFNKNKLTLNVTKTNYCRFSSSSIQLPDLEISIGGTRLARRDAIRNLGVIVDERLSWQPHVEHLVSKLQKYTGIFSKIRRYVSNTAYRTLYFSLIYPVLLYCLEIWGQANITTITPLLLLQKKIIRIMKNAPYRAATAPLFSFFRIRPLPTEIKYRLDLLAFHAVRVSPHRYTSLNIQINHPHDRATRYTEHHIPILRFRSQRYGSYGLMGRIISAYNNLPLELRTMNPPRMSTARRILNMRSQHDS
jgi:hypothetical protein